MANDHFTEDDEEVGRETRQETKTAKICSKDYWVLAAKQIKNVRMLIIGAVICALRIAVKAFRIPLGAGLYLTFDAYINSVGSFIYGPLIGLMVGAVSDTIGAFLFPSGAYFFPYIFTEMASSFIFALFFWKRKITVPRAVFAKFTVNLICNIILTSFIMKWDYALHYTGKTYNIVNLSRIVKNLVLFPLEGTLIVIVLNALIPVLKNFRFADGEQNGLAFRKKDIVLIIVLSLCSVALVVLYVFFLKDYVSSHNLKLF